jgi:hypothetical protein
MPDILDVLPRIVLPNGAVMLPGDWHYMTPEENTVTLLYDLIEVDISQARFDRPAGMKGNDGRRVYENDLLNGHRVYWCVETPGFRIELPEFDNPTLGLYLVNPYAQQKDFDITGMVPYGEEVS